ncbi:MAG: SEL1-like repeat protein, partial [Planctomycetia bacterium]|nr:SEL1-like repeat protein [Planctomycetia bacterium]
MSNSPQLYDSPEEETPCAPVDENVTIPAPPPVSVGENVTIPAPPPVPVHEKKLSVAVVFATLRKSVMWTFEQLKKVPYRCLWAVTSEKARALGERIQPYTGRFWNAMRKISFRTWFFSISATLYAFLSLVSYVSGNEPEKRFALAFLGTSCLLVLFLNRLSRFFLRMITLGALVYATALLTSCVYLSHTSPAVAHTFWYTCLVFGCFLSFWSVIALFLFWKMNREEKLGIRPEKRQKRYQSFLLRTASAKQHLESPWSETVPTVPIASTVPEKSKVKPTPQPLPTEKRPRRSWKTFCADVLAVTFATLVLVGVAWSCETFFHEKRRTQLIDSLAEKGVAFAQYRRGMRELTADTGNVENAFHWLHQAAEQHFIPANTQVAGMYFDGVGTLQDTDLAFQNWLTAAEAGDVRAMIHVGDCWLEGYATDIESSSDSEKQALRWFQKAGEKGDAEGQYRTAMCCFDGIGMSKNTEVGEYWLQLAVATEYPDALFSLGKMRVEGTPLEMNVSVGIELLERAETLGNEDASTFLADYYLHGAGLEKAQEKCMAWLWNVAHSESSVKNKVACEKLDELFLDTAWISTFPEQGFAWLCERAEQNKPEFQFQLAQCLKKGRGAGENSDEAVEPDPVEAFSWFLHAAELGFVEAQYETACALQDGVGIDVDLREAFNWFSRAAQMGHTESQYRLGHCCFEGIGISQDRPLGAEWLMKAAENGHKKAISLLNDYFIDGTGLEETPTLALSWLKKVAEEGNVLAQQRLKRYFTSDSGIQNNPREAFQLLTQQAEAGNVDAQAKLGECYLLGFGTRMDAQKAVLWLEKAAKQKHTRAAKLLEDYLLNGTALKDVPEFAVVQLTNRGNDGSLDAMYRLGEYYLAKGNGERTRNPQEAVTWLQKAADGKHALAQQTLTRYILNDSGLQEAPTEAFIWLEKPEQEQNPIAQVTLAKYYKNGTATYASPQKATMHFQKAAELGNAEAQYEIGLCYKNGTGVVADVEKSYEWFSKAANQG